MAYGVILRIIPQTQIAQAVLINLFSSPELKACVDDPSHAAGEIIRLARTKALAARPVPNNDDTKRLRPVVDMNDTVEKVVFDLSFCQGYTPDAIAEKLHLSRTNVMKSIYVYFKDLRSS
ncbi:hypothetical protein [Spirosoma pollinicola]|nr:hypothetical protein [Spirosoma pollinicola]